MFSILAVLSIMLSGFRHNEANNCALLREIIVIWSNKGGTSSKFLSF